MAKRIRTILHKENNKGGNMPLELDTITFDEFLDIREKLYDNSEEIASNEVQRGWNLIHRGEYHYTHLQGLIDTGGIDASNFRDYWYSSYLVESWNEKAYGKKYPQRLTEYQKLASNPKSVQKLKLIVENATRGWGYVWNRSKIAIKGNRFLSFWEYNQAYNDTKGSWRHWWDTLDHGDKFKAGDIAELRSNANSNHIYELYVHPRDSHYKCIRTIGFRGFKKFKGKILMVIAYDQQVPDKTYSYKKSQGSHRLVTVLPIGSTTIYYIPEQFLKISRKKTVKDAKAKR